MDTHWFVEAPRHCWFKSAFLLPPSQLFPIHFFIPQVFWSIFLPHNFVGSTIQPPNSCWFKPRFSGKNHIRRSDPNVCRQNHPNVWLSRISKQKVGMIVTDIGMIVSNIIQHHPQVPIIIPNYEFRIFYCYTVYDPHSYQHHPTSVNIIPKFRLSSSAIPRFRQRGRVLQGHRATGCMTWKLRWKNMG